MKCFMLGRSVIKIRALASAADCRVVSGRECHEADSGWLQGVGLVDGG